MAVKTSGAKKKVAKRTPQKKVDRSVAKRTSKKPTARQTVKKTAEIKSSYRFWIGNGDHPEIKDLEAKENPGLTALFPTETAEAIAPPGAKFIAAVATSPRPGSDIRDGYFIGPSPNRNWKWVLWAFTFDDNWETWSWVVRATSDQTFEDARTAAAAIMEAVWVWERQNWGKSLFDEVEDTGLLTENAVWEIGKRAYK